MEERPKECPDKTCRYFRQRVPQVPGASGWCTGKLSEGYAEAVGDFLHINDLSLCIFDGGDRPPVRYFTRTQDLILMGSDFTEWGLKLALDRERTPSPPKQDEE